MRSITKLLALVTFACVALSAQAADLPRRPSFGAALTPNIDDATRTANKIAPGEGMQIVAILPGLSAEAAGLQAKDIVVRIGGRKVAAVTDIQAVLRTKRIGDTVDVGIVRAAERRTVALPLKGLPFETSPDFDIAYDAVEAANSIRRTIITRPRGSGRFPAVLLVGGIGCPSFDEPLSDSPYKKLVHDLTRQGFVTMRVEKSGMGDSTGAPCAEVDLVTEVEGYTAGLRALKRLAFVDAKRAFIVGHSIGGITGPLVAGKEPVKGLFVMETVGFNWFEYELINARRQLKLGGDTPAAVNAQMFLKEWCMHRLLIDRTPRADILKVKPACAEYMQYPASDAYVQQVAAQNLAELWANLKGVDVGVLYGAADFVTGVDESKAVVDAANAARAGSAEYIELADMDHFLLQMPDQPASLKRLSTNGPGNYHPALSQTVGDWLKKHSK